MERRDTTNFSRLSAVHADFQIRFSCVGCRLDLENTFSDNHPSERICVQVWARHNKQRVLLFGISAETEEHSAAVQDNAEIWVK